MFSIVCMYGKQPFFLGKGFKGCFPHDPLVCEGDEKARHTGKVSACTASTQDTHTDICVCMRGEVVSLFATGVKMNAPHLVWGSHL